MRPYCAMAKSAIAWPPSRVATEEVSAMASPPWSRISCAVSSAELAELPSASFRVPMSFTTTRAPRAASSFA